MLSYIYWWIPHRWQMQIVVLHFSWSIVNLDNSLTHLQIASLNWIYCIMNVACYVIRRKNHWPFACLMCIGSTSVLPPTESGVGSLKPQHNDVSFDDWWANSNDTLSGLIQKGLNSIIILRDLAIWNHCNFCVFLWDFSMLEWGYVAHQGGVTP